jgi:hypothetical protein
LERDIVELCSFVDKVVISSVTNRRFLIKKITAPEIHVVTEVPGTSGYPEHYVYGTINGDPISAGLLVFENQALTEPFKEAFEAYSHTQDAYWENYGYWMRKD